MGDLHWSVLERRRDLLITFIATQLGTQYPFFCPTPVTEYRITGQRDEIAAIEVTATDWFRLLVRYGAIRPRARAATTRYAMKKITRNPNDTIAAAAASGLIDASRASLVDHDCLHAKETMFFWRKILEDNLENLMHGLVVMVTPTMSE